MIEPSHINLENHDPEIDNEQKDFTPASSVLHNIKQLDIQDFREYSKLA